MFTRVELRDEGNNGGKFFEVPEVNWINPRQLHRHLVRVIENRGYTVDPDETGFSLAKESIGDKTGTVQASLAGYRRVRGEIPFRSAPFKVLGIALAILAVLALGPAIIFEGAARAASVGLFLVLAGLGAAAILYRRRALMPAHARLQLRILIEGEVTERTVTDQGTTATGLMAQLAISASSSNVHQADGSRATAAERDAFRKKFQEEVEVLALIDERANNGPLTPFSQFLASNSPFWKSVGRETAIRWKQLAVAANADFAAVRSELESLATEFHDVKPVADIQVLTSATPEIDAEDLEAEDAVDSELEPSSEPVDATNDEPATPADDDEPEEEILEEPIAN